MSLIRPGPLGDDTSSSALTLLVQRYEADWRSSSGIRPDPRKYLPEDPGQRPAALLTLLRTELVLRWRAQEPSPIEAYRESFPELDDESLVALLYEEYCLREDAGESPESTEYQTRFPDLAASFQEVLEIHDLIGRPRAPGSTGPGRNGVALPEAGQTIAGFRLVEELGRGAFARVYLAEEQHLADRPVALKVTRTGSREPQTLARLQHTHIVPVYSYRTDAASGLHLLCMPYLGRITLLQILNHPEIRAVRTGAELVNLLDRLQPSDDALVERAASRTALARGSYAQAIAWWGARMAEALHHAHDRHVLHRDVKPSNVLVTGDGLPMLLDFNLAQQPWIDHAEAAPTTPGGTLAYMAPEHLEALAGGGSNQVDARSDLYALGVVLFDCLVRGTRSFALPSNSLTMTEALLKAAEVRRRVVPRLRATHPDVPPALEAVVRRCLAPEPGDRYRSAAQLAADLQAVADDRPLRFAREPLRDRCIGWLRRNRRRLAIVAPLVLALGAFVYSFVSAQLASLQLKEEVRQRVDQARHSVEEDRLELALSQLATAARLAEGDPRLQALHDQIREEQSRARETKKIRDQADELFQDGDRLHFSLLGFGVDTKAACRWVESALAKFSIPDDPAWIRRPPMDRLDRRRRDRLISEVNELLFLWVVALEGERSGDPEASRLAVRICDVALAFARPVGPWRVIRERCAATLAGEQPHSQVPTRTEGEASTRGCFQWALLCELEGRREAVVAWLERATRLEPQDYWSQFYLGDYHRRLGQAERAMEHIQAAVVLRPDSPWARSHRGFLYYARGDWDDALDDLNRALAAPQRADLLEARLQLGVVKQVLGDDPGARAAYDSVIAAGPNTPLARAGRLNRAKLDIDAGAVDRAWAEYAALLAEDPRDAPARLSRALLALRLGRAAQSETDLTILLQEVPEQADELLARRALARLALGRLEGAEEDAAGAYRRKPSPSRERLWIRTLLALHRVEDLFWLSRPGDLTILPGGGPSLLGDLREAAERLRFLAGGNRAVTAPARVHRTRAVLLSALDDSSAEAEASRALALAPEVPDAYLVRARVRRRSGDRPAALADVESGLALVPGDPRLLELRGVLKTEMGNPEAALIDLDRAILRGAQATAHVPRALALMALGRDEDAVRDWSLALDDDPENPEAYLGRARARIRLRFPDRALVDLEQAAVWAGDNPTLLPRITATYALCLGSRPDRFSRWLILARRAWSLWIAATRPIQG
jgi:serine/threonine protein kinase/tetratricopeptide (TPR) repeat protein